MLNSHRHADSRPRVVVTAPEYGRVEDCLRSHPALECLRAPDEERELAAAIRETQSRHAVVGLRTYTGALYDTLPRGGVIARFGVGHDGIDKVKATRAGLLCTNTPGVLDQPVAEHTMLLVGAAARSLVPVAGRMVRNTWEPEAGHELHGKTLAVIGCGAIGRAVARIASLGYRMQVVGLSRPGVPPPTALEHFDAVTNEFAAAVRSADFVSLHIPANERNVGFMNRERLALLGKRAWLINTARGSVVDERALFAALTEHRIAGAALDVFDREPYEPADSHSDLRSLPNVILTPHVGGNTFESNRRVAERALQNIAFAEMRDFARMDLLNPEVLA